MGHTIRLRAAQELRNNGPWDAGVQSILHTSKHYNVVLKTIKQYLPLSLPFFFFSQAFSLSPGLAKNSRQSSCLHLPSSGLTDVCLALTRRLLLEFIENHHSRRYPFLVAVLGYTKSRFL